MSNRPLNHFGNTCYGSMANMFDPGHLLSFELLYQVYGEEGDGTDLGFCNDSDFIPVGEIPDQEDDFWSQFGMSVIDASEAEDFPGDDEFPLFPEEKIWRDSLSSPELFNKPVVMLDEECIAVIHGCNHRNRDPWVHNKKKQFRIMRGRRSPGERRKLDRQHRQSIRRIHPADE